MSELNCPKCSTRFVQGETICEFCGYKPISKFSFKKRVPDPISENEALRDFELEILDRESARKSIFRHSERKLFLQVTLGSCLIFVVLMTFIVIVLSK